MRTYARTNCSGKCNRPPDAAINPRTWPKGARRRPPARRPVSSHAWPVRPLRLPGATWRLREAQGISSRFDGLLGSRHRRGAATRFPRKPAHSGCCQTWRSQILPCSRGKLRRPTHHRIFTASGTNVRGMNPGKATEPGSSSKITGLAPPLNAGARLAGSLDPAKPRKLARLADPARRVDSASTTGARQPNPAWPKPPQQASATHGVLRNPAMGQLPSHPGRMMERDLNHR